MILDEFPERPARQESAKVDHEGDSGLLAGGDRAIHRSPRRRLEVGGLHACDHVPMHMREAGNLSCVEVPLFGVLGHHAVAGNVDERQRACGRAIDDRRAKALKIAPAGASGIDHGRHAGSEAEAVRPHAGVAGPGACDPGCGEEAGVDAHQIRTDAQPGDVEREPGFIGLEPALNRDDAATRHCHVVVSAPAGPRGR